MRVSVARMQQIDAAAIETLGIPRLLLMEHAGLAVARAVQALSTPSHQPVLVCCGTGFNGGDGFSAARHLHEWGYPLCILVAGRLERLREEPATYATILQRLRLPVMEYASADALDQVERWLAECGLVIDALLGIGTRGAVREPVASLIASMNRSGKPIVAVDVPSGLDADTGLVQGVAVKATVTVTFGLPKHGCFTHEGPTHVGAMTVDPITIPRALLEASVR
jgi:NAD(P)H-hydrate epimerase